MTHGEYRRNQLLGYLPRDLVITEEARQILEEAELEGGLPANSLDARVRLGVGGFPTEAQVYGIPSDSPAYLRLDPLKGSAEAFTIAQLNKVPPREVVAELMTTLKTLRSAITEITPDPAYTKYLEVARRSLVQACATASKAEKLSCLEEDGAFLMQVFLEAARLPISEGGGDLRSAVAEGLLLLAREASCLDETVTTSLRALAEDPEPNVRFELISHITCLYHTQAELMWEFLEEKARREEDTLVLRGLIVEIQRLAGRYPSRSTEVATTVLSRRFEGREADYVRSGCINIFTGLYVYQDFTPAHDELKRLFERPESSADAITLAISAVRDCLSDSTERRHRALQLWREALDVAKIGWRELDTRIGGKSQDSWTASDTRSLQHLATIFDHLALNLFLSANINEVAGGPSEGSDGSDRLVSYFGEIRSLLADMTSVGTPNTAYNLLRLFEAFLPFEPETILLWIGESISAGKKFGFQYEPMAGDLFARIVQRILAQHAAAVRLNPACARTLVEVLNIFVDAGWPAAYRLTYQLGDLYR
jgi:hypothetical protein